MTARVRALFGDEPPIRHHVRVEHDYSTIVDPDGYVIVRENHGDTVIEFSSARVLLDFVVAVLGAFSFLDANEERDVAAGRVLLDDPETVETQLRTIR